MRPSGDKESRKDRRPGKLELAGLPHGIHRLERRGDDLDEHLVLGHGVVA